MIQPVIPIAEASPDESVAPVQELPTDHNWADNEDVAGRFVNEYLPVIKWLMANRQGLSDLWAQNRRMDLMIHDENQKYIGRSNAYIPGWARANKTLISNMSAGLFPSDEFIDVAALYPEGDEDAKAMKAFAMYQLTDVAKVPNLIKAGLREFHNTGNMVTKIWWNKEKQHMRKRVNGVERLDTQRVSYNEGLAVSIRSVHNVFFYPVTAESMRDVQMVTEIVQVPNSTIKEMGRKNHWLNTDAAINNRNEMYALLESARLIGEKDKLTTDALSPASGDLGQSYILEIYTYMQLPKSAYLEGEDTEAPLPVQIFAVGGTPMLIRRNPFFHQCIPYRVARDNVHAGSFYGLGTASYIRGLQYLASDFANQGNDAAIYALNPVTKINPSFMVGPPPRLRPGAVWRMTDIDKGMSFDRPPTELITAGQSVLQFWMGAIADFGGAPPVLQGKSGGGSAKTATGSQILQRNALQPLQDVIDDIGDDVMLPMMKMMQTLARQYQDRSLGLLIMGKPGTVSPEIFDKDFEFKFLSSSQAVNQQMRSQQVLTLLQAAAPLIPYMMQLGYQFDPVPLLKRAYYDGLGFRGFDEIFKRGMPMGMMQQPGQAPGAGGQPAQGQQQDTAQNQTSAFPGGEQMAHPVPGEGDEIGAVKTPAEELAGMMGSMGGMS